MPSPQPHTHTRRRGDAILTCHLNAELCWEALPPASPPDAPLETPFLLYFVYLRAAGAGWYRGQRTTCRNLLLPVCRMGLGLKFKLPSLEADTLEPSHGPWKLLKVMGAKVPKGEVGEKDKKCVPTSLSPRPFSQDTGERRTKVGMTTWDPLYRLKDKGS